MSKTCFFRLFARFGHPLNQLSSRVSTLCEKIELFADNIHFEKAIPTVSLSFPSVLSSRSVASKPRVKRSFPVLSPAHTTPMVTRHQGKYKPFFVHPKERWEQLHVWRWEIDPIAKSFLSQSKSIFDDESDV